MCVMAKGLLSLLLPFSVVCPNVSLIDANLAVTVCLFVLLFHFPSSLSLYCAHRRETKAVAVPFPTFALLNWQMRKMLCSFSSLL